MAPECAITGKASKESEVYSFGIVALEIACGKNPINLEEERDGDKISVVRWVWDLYGEGKQKLLEGADPRLDGDFDEQQLVCLMVVGVWCAHLDAKLRPSIRQAIQVLNFEAPLPVLPLKMPEPSYVSCI
ncbi:hypothetical protein JCGZ_06945 [Jatropha curcas]|uniref:Serine-threonine/tyrosine-protein kinase catalytic domain-containing protein n=1 Tax=Jatropha curcas TaxID=180498 RepID=A0A067KN75_JATCU|nr:hypothetical protein JCGZ_06945 [Jatropha curcas]